jgi:hypothetical protein
MNHRIIVFDDVDTNRIEVINVLTKTFTAKGEVLTFAPGAAKLFTGPYEERLAADLTQPPNAPMSLIVADRDLSRLEPGYGGLSEQTVRRVADVLGIPECGYARGEDDPEKLYLEEGEQAEAAIRLALRPEDIFAKQVLSIADGFAGIQECLPPIIKGGKGKSLAMILAEILGKPEYADKISLYASGDRNRLAALSRVKRGQDEKEIHRRLACFFGYWLWDSILRFPGVVVNEVAASSYLNIREDVFQDAQVQEPFRPARYNGPFAEAKGKLWWRGMLDDIVSDGGFADGKELASKFLNAKLTDSRCCEEPAKSAGYYCMIRRKPVRLENSVSGMSWFPRGADLARISRSANQEDAPWHNA